MEIITMLCLIMLIGFVSLIVLSADIMSKRRDRMEAERAFNEILEDMEED